MRTFNHIPTWIDTDNDTVSLIRWAGVSLASTLILMGAINLAQYLYEHLLG